MPKVHRPSSIVHLILLATTALRGLLAAWPMLTRPGLPVFTDTELHVYRTFEILSAWRAGAPFIRWGLDERLEIGS